MAIKILEETLSIKSVLSNKLSELINNFLDICLLIICGIWSSINSLGTNLTNWMVNSLFKTFLCENFINSITELSPLNVCSCFWCLE